MVAGCGQALCEEFLALSACTADGCSSSFGGQPGPAASWLASAGLDTGLILGKKEQDRTTTGDPCPYDVTEYIQRAFEGKWWEDAVRATGGWELAEHGKTYCELLGRQCELEGNEVFCWCVYDWSPDCVCKPELVPYAVPCPETKRCGT